MSCARNLAEARPAGDTRLTSEPIISGRPILAPPLLELVTDTDIRQAHPAARAFLAPGRPLAAVATSGQEPAVVVVEAHVDDAVLSLGGLMLSLDRPLRVVTVFSESDSVHPQVAPLLANLDIVPHRLRELEARAAAGAVGADWVPLGFSEIGSMSPSPDAELRERVIEALLKVAPPTALVLLPAGFGRHPDHLFLAQCEAVFDRGALYEDVGPAPAYARCTEDFWSRYDELRPTHAPIYFAIDHACESKLDVAGLFRSQFSPRQARAIVRYAEAVGISGAHLFHEIPRGRFFERLYVRSERAESVRRTLFAGKRNERHPACGSCNERPDAVPLEPSVEADPRVVSLFASRRSGRALTGLPLPLPKIACVLELCARANTDFDPVRFAYPTAGGLGSSGLTVLPWNVAGLEAAAHRYDPVGHSLQQVGPIPLRSKLHGILGSQDWVLGASVGFLLDVEFAPAEARYGTGAWQLLLIESGHFAQALQAVLCDLGLQCVVIPAFDKPELDHLCPGRRPTCLVIASSQVPSTMNGPSREMPAAPAFISADSHDEEPPVSDIRLSVRRIGLEEGHSFFLSRCRIPTTDRASAGWRFLHSCETSPAACACAENAARVCAAAEAREVFTARTAVVREIVQGRPPRVEGTIVEAERVLVDAQGRAAAEMGRIGSAPRGQPRYWLRMSDWETSEAVWLPTDAVLMDRRFFGAELLPTSTGLACRPVLADALRHAVFEVLEKAVLTSWSFPWDEVTTSSQRGAPLVDALEHRRQRVTIRTTELGGLHASRVTCTPSGARGGAVRTNRDAAIEAALGECLAKVFAGVGQVDESLGARPPYRGTGRNGVLGELTELGIRLAYAQLRSVEEDVFPLRSWPVVKVIAWRSS